MADLGTFRVCSPCSVDVAGRRRLEPNRWTASLLYCLITLLLSPIAATPSAFVPSFRFFPSPEERPLKPKAIITLLSPARSLGDHYDGYFHNVLL